MVTWPLIVSAGLMLSLCVASLGTLSSIRAFVNGEGLWSKAERQAIAELRHFADSGAEADYQRFRDELAVPLGDRAARLELQGSDPHYAIARNEFLAGRNHPDDVPGMVRLFRLFRHSSLLARPIGAWTQADEFILQLDEIGRQMHLAMSTGGGDRERMVQLLAAAEHIHGGVAPLEDEFSASLGSTSRLVLKLLSAFLALCSIILVGTGAAISRNMIRRSERIALALREAEEQAFVAQARSHVTLQSIADAVLCTNRACEVTYMNAAAEQLIGWPAAEAVGRPLTAVLRMLPEPNTYSVTTEIEQILAGEQRTGPAAGSMLQKRDGSTTPVHERAAPIRDSHGEVIGIAFVMRDITNERAFAAQLLHQATHDALTGLANRREFEQRVGAAIANHQRTGSDHALLYLDLDQFKVVNDTCGHAAGDELICQVSWAVKQELRADDVLARLGGDEFGVLLANCRAKCGAQSRRIHPSPHLRAAVRLGRQDIFHQCQHRRAVPDGETVDGRRCPERCGPGLLPGEGQWPQSRSVLPSGRPGDARQTWRDALGGKTESRHRSQSVRPLRPGNPADRCHCAAPTARSRRRASKF